MMGRRQQPHQDVIGNRYRKEIPAHVTSLKNRPIDGLALTLCKLPSQFPHVTSASPVGRTGRSNGAANSPVATFAKHVWHKHSSYRALIQSICRSVTPILPHQHWYPTHSKTRPQLSHVLLVGPLISIVLKHPDTSKRQFVACLNAAEDR